MSAKNVNRCFTRRARHQFNPFTLDETQPHQQPDKQLPTAQTIKLNIPAPEKPTPPRQGQNKIRVTSSQQPASSTPRGKQAITNTEHPIPELSRRRYYVQKHRVGKKTISTYIGIKGAAADIEYLDTLDRQFRLEHLQIARALIARLKHLHTANENQYNEVEAQFVTTMTSAGYHRIDRHQWSKVRGCKSLRMPNTEHLTPARSVPTPNTERLTPALHWRIQACRRHIQAMHELFSLTADLGHTKTACRVYDRYAKRAVNRLAAAEKSLQTLQTIAARQQAQPI